MANNPDSDFNLKCQIIEEVRQRPILFNKGHPMYFVRNAKNDEFTNIGLALGITDKYQLESHCVNMIKCLENILFQAVLSRQNVRSQSVDFQWYQADNYCAM